MTHAATTETDTARTALRFAGCGLLLPASLLAPFVLIAGVAAVLGSAHGFVVDEAVGAVAALALVVGGLGVGGAAWGAGLGRVGHIGRTWAMALAGSATHVVMTLFAAQALGALEQEFVERGNTALPIHVVFTLLFVPATFIVAFVMCGALSLATGKGKLALGVAARSALAAALAFLVLNIAQDLLGRRVGGPNAAETATMITVMLIGNIGAAMAMSVVAGRALSRSAAFIPQPTSSPVAS